MAKKRSGKRSGAKNKKRWNPFSGRLFMTLLICGAIIGGAAYGFRYFFINSDFFTVREIYINRDTGYVFKEGETKLTRLFSGRNIFLINLKEVQDAVKNDFPQLKKVEVRRRFPNRIEIDMLTREPIAVIEYGGGVVIDREAVVVYAGQGKAEGLLKIKGVGFFLNMPSKGDRIRNPMLEKGLVLLDGVRKKMGPNLKNIDYIDISDKNNIVLSIHGVDVKMGADDFSHKIDRLNEMLEDPKLNLKEINYIDLRFSDAVIAPK
jgi:cell division septal protein FtsQ